MALHYDQTYGRLSQHAARIDMDQTHGHQTTLLRSRHIRRAVGIAILRLGHCDSVHREILEPIDHDHWHATGRATFSPPSVAEQYRTITHILRASFPIPSLPLCTRAIERPVPSFCICNTVVASPLQPVLNVCDAVDRVKDIPCQQVSSASFGLDEIIPTA
ncbi:hypothetical protein BDU57DRAFT_114505 [Ampelomyces quisqualis]|uniref:Uncharacterized protein n=1 Tax=Ampelomyces quisqualis TaxID=50730 RepID=A0A6A5Q8D5_AMPQU|nr:hypothetical protein BDU57DRAFT_114505 [Ampelomyces quisqualis]